MIGEGITQTDLPRVQPVRPAVRLRHYTSLRLH